MTFQEHMFPATSMPDRDWWSVLWPNPESVVNTLGIQPGMTVIDLGCGYGYFTPAIAKKIAPAIVMGFDLDPDMLEQAKIACRGLTNCSWQLGDAMELSQLVQQRVDYVLLANTLHGVPDKQTLASEIAAILKPGGRVGIINWHHLPRETTIILNQARGPATELRLSPEQTRILFAAAGFQQETVIELPPYHYGMIFSK
jgi:ubiquinone/menaquinone biosynthesis C-methylase UbiE